MLRRIGLCVTLALASTGCCDALPEQRRSPEASEIQNIRVDYQHSGWVHLEEQFTLVPVGNGTDFVLRARYIDGEKKQQDIEQPVSLPAVQVLLAAASAPAWSREAGVRAVAATVKRAQISKIRPSISIPPRLCTPQELQQLARAYVKRKGMAALIDEHYGRGISWTDDYPQVLLQIQFRSGPPLRMYSNSQKAMMLPWYRGIPVTSPLESDQNWALSLSRALRAVMPPQSSLYERLGGDRLPDHLNRQVEYRAGKECDAVRSPTPGR